MAAVTVVDNTCVVKTRKQTFIYLTLKIDIQKYRIVEATFEEDLEINSNSILTFYFTMNMLRGE